MKNNKILTVLMVTAILISIFQVTAFANEMTPSATPAVTIAAATPAPDVSDASATPAAYGVEVALYLMESNEAWSFGDIAPKEWSEPKSESVFISEDGTYTFSLTDLDIPADKFMLCYIKDVAAYPKDTTVTHSNVPDDLMVITDVFKVNGITKEVNDKVRTGLKNGLFDVAYRNNWDENDNCVDFSTTVNSVELTITVTGITGEPGALVYEPSQAATPTVTAVSNDTAASDNEAVTTEAGAAKDSSFKISLPIIIGIGAGVVIIIAIILIAVRKKK